MFFDYMMPNPYFKITIIPNLLLIYIAGLFQNMIISSCADIESYIQDRNGFSKTPEHLLFMYIFSTITHYTLILIYMSIIGWYLQKNDIFSSKMHTYQYLMVNHNDFHRMGSGKIHSLIERRTKAITELIDIFILNLYGGLTYIVTTSISIYKTFGYELAAFNLAVIGFYIISCFLFGPILNSYRVKASESENVASNRIFGIIHNYDTIKSFNNDRSELVGLDLKLDSLEKDWTYFEILQDFIRFVQNTIIIAPNCFIFYLAIKKQIFFTSFIQLSTYNKMFMSLKNKIDTIGREVVKIIEHGSNLNYDCIRDFKEDDTGEGVEVHSLNEKITFRDFQLKIPIVSNSEINNDNLSFNNDNVLILPSSFTIFKGEKVAIVGKNGTGKSTLMKTLLRFYDYEGEIFIDNLETKEISVKSQRALMAYIPQTPFISEGTVIQNLKYANPKMRDADVIELSKTYKTHRVFKEMENGYLTQVGENGRNMSGGQKQQISFLRGIIKDSDIMLVDEPTANLDHHAEKEMIGAILKSDKTVLVIIHNFQYLSKFDKILGINNKKVNVYENYDDFNNDMHLY